MKHLLTTFLLVFFSIATQAAQEKTLSKEKKSAAKVMKVADL